MATEGRALRIASISCLCTVLSGCLNIDALRARSGDGGTDSGRPEMNADSGPDAAAPACVGDVRDVRLWKLHLGQSDYVTLKNTSTCAVELSGLLLLLDDVDASVGADADCEIQLPPFRLQPEAQVRVHEDPLPGDIGALENELTACSSDVSFNPVRGGVTYLCDGACTRSTVIDVVAHQGESIPTPPLLFEQTFAAPLTGVTMSGQDSMQYRRVAVRGAAPNFLGSDWQLEIRFAYASFERDVEVDVGGVARAWTPEEGRAATFTSTSEAAVGDVALRLQHRGGDGRSSGLALGLGATPEEGTPTDVSFYVRTDTPSASTAYFDLQGGGFSAIQASFEAGSLGTEIENGARTELLAAADTWYQVELRDIDWAAHRYDLYVDRVLIGSGVHFWSNAFAAERLSLYSISSDTTALWDEIELWAHE